MLPIAPTPSAPRPPWLCVCASFQVAMLKNQNRGCGGGGGIKKSVHGIEPYETAADRLAVHYLRNNVQRGEVGQQIGGADGRPFRRAMGHRGKIAQIFTKCPNHKEGKRKDNEKNRSRERRKQERDGGDNQEFQDDEIDCDQQAAIASG